MRDSPRPSLISVRGWNSRSSLLGCFKLGRRRGSDSRSSGSRVGGEDLTQGLKDELWPPQVLIIREMGEG